MLSPTISAGRAIAVRSPRFREMCLKQTRVNVFSLVLDASAKRARNHLCLPDAHYTRHFHNDDGDVVGRALPTRPSIIDNTTAGSREPINGPGNGGIARNRVSDQSAVGIRTFDINARQTFPTSPYKTICVGMLLVSRENENLSFSFERFFFFNKQNSTIAFYMYTLYFTYFLPSSARRELLHFAFCAVRVFLT